MTLTDVLNPKLAIFFLTIVPQVVTPGTPESTQVMVLSAVFVAIAAIWLTTYVMAMHGLSSVLS